MEVRKAFYEQLALYDHVTVEHGALAAMTHYTTQQVHADEHRFGRPDHVHADERYTDVELRVASPRSVGEQFARWASNEDQQEVAA